MRGWSLHKIHISWQIGLLAWGILLGIAVSPQLGHISLGQVLYMMVGVLLLPICIWLRWRILGIFVLCSGICFGVARGATELTHMQEYTKFFGRVIQVTGTVSEDVVLAKSEQRVRLKDIYIHSTSLRGEIWTSVASEYDIVRGDRIVVSGKLVEGFGTFAAVIHRGRIIKILEGQNNDVARVVRDRFTNGVRESVSAPESLLGIGYITGQQSALPEALNENLQVTGLTHIVVASGYNLTILVGFARSLLIRVSKYTATLGASLMIASFMLIAGFSPSMVRAGMVTCLSLFAWYYGRTIHPLILLPFVAALTAIYKPVYVWGDLGWYLSFGAFAAVIIFAPLLRCYFWGDTKPGALVQIATDTFSAQLLTMPILLFAFGKFSVYALLANMLVLPFVPLAMLLTFISGIAGLVTPFGQWIGWPAYMLLRYMTWIVEQIAGLPHAQKDLSITLLQLALCYLGLFLITIFLWRRTRLKFRSGQ